MRIFLISLMLSVFAYAESYVTCAKVLSSLKKGESLTYLLPCSFGGGESLCAVIHSTTYVNIFRVYSANDDSKHSLKVEYTMYPGDFGAQGLIASYAKDHEIKLTWSQVGVHSEGKNIETTVKYDQGEYKLSAGLEGKELTKYPAEFIGHWEASQFNFNQKMYRPDSTIEKLITCVKKKKPKLHLFLVGMNVESAEKPVYRLTDAYYCKGEINLSSCAEQSRECK